MPRGAFPKEPSRLPPNPACPKCGKRMLLEEIRVVPNSNPIALTYTFKCSCGAEQTLGETAG
jgi:lysyl-tRNA synthetase class I